MHGSGVFQLEIMTVANVAGGTQTNGRHPSGDRRPDAASAILNHETFVRLYAQLVRGEQENIRMRLAPRDHIGAEDMAAEFGFQRQHLKTKL